ncbi:MAG: hypothetical protein PHE67_00265 [Campylobacterales bacterium]|nr:hypothetical protein [Campylobacterales bacterium]
MKKITKLFAAITIVMLFGGCDVTNYLKSDKEIYTVNTGIKTTLSGVVNLKRSYAEPCGVGCSRSPIMASNGTVFITEAFSREINKQELTQEIQKYEEEIKQQSANAESYK